jgi:hypothetical protein
MLSRRNFLHLLAGGAALASIEPATAREARIDRLIGASSALPTIGRRIDFISRALIGTRYRGYTLIGGPHQRERFVLRDDAFDCVTYCETVLAAAIARKPAGFAPALRAIRYHNGVIAWRERNHYFFEWSAHNVANGTCRAIALDGAVEIDKTVTWHKALGRRHFALHAIPRARFLANRAKLATGDIVGFVTRRPDLDYFHVGFVAFGPKREFLLRHASEHHGRVLDEPMQRFCATNHVRYVTLLRPLEPATVA